MGTHQDAAEQLGATRSMMERTTIFRALSGEAALLGGAVSLAASWIPERHQHMNWGAVWLAGLGIVLIFAFWQLSRAAVANQRILWSHGLKVALRGGLPPIIAGGFLGLIYLKSGLKGAEYGAASMWITHYGLALLAIHEFAPKSMTWPGIAFLLTGIASFSALTFPQAANPLLARIGPSGLMAATFGGFHLPYGAAIVTTTRRSDSGE